MSKPHAAPILMTVGAALLWSSSFSVAKVGLRYIAPYTFVFLRFLVGILLKSSMSWDTESGLWRTVTSAAVPIHSSGTAATTQAGGCHEAFTSAE